MYLSSPCRIFALQNCRGGRPRPPSDFDTFCRADVGISLYKLTAIGFTAAVGTKICGAVPAAAAFPRLYGSFSTAFGTEIGTVFLSAYAAPLLTVPRRSSLVFSSHAEKRLAVCHILQAHNGKSEYKHTFHLTAETLYSLLSDRYRRIPILSMKLPKVL